MRKNSTIADLHNKNNSRKSPFTCLKHKKYWLEALTIFCMDLMLIFFGLELVLPPLGSRSKAKNGKNSLKPSFDDYVDGGGDFAAMEAA